MLIRFLLWLLRLLGGAVCTQPHWPDLNHKIVARARALSAQQEVEHPEPGQGEVKRHRVLAQLRKERPDAPARELALAIERAQWPVESP